MQKVETQSWTLKARGWRAKESERRNETKDMRGGVNKTDIINYVRSWIFQCDTKLRGLIYHVTFFSSRSSVFALSSIKREMKTDPLKRGDRSCPQKILFAIWSRFSLLIVLCSMLDIKRERIMINFMSYGISLSCFIMIQ